MDAIRDEELEKTVAEGVVPFLGSIALATLLPLLQNQLVVGPLVNALLYLVTILLGKKKALVIALIPSGIAVAIGQLPMVLLPMIPLIIASNCLLVLIFDSLWKKQYWIGVGVASFVKFLFLQLTSIVIISYFIPTAVAPNAALMMSWPQLATSLMGGVIAWMVLQIGKIQKKRMEL